MAQEAEEVFHNTIAELAKEVPVASVSKAKEINTTIQLLIEARHQ